MEDNKSMSAEEMEVYFHKLFLKSTTRKEDFILATGPGGAKLFEITLALESEKLTGSVSPEREEEIIKKFEDKYYKPGTYEFSTEGIKWFGYEDQTMSDGGYLFQDTQSKKWHLHLWKDGWLKDGVTLTEEEAIELIKENEKRI